MGQLGELLAADYLRARGYAILTTNWRAAPYGEIDIVAQQAATFVFIEVRARRGRHLTDALASITARKRARMVAAAQVYCAAHGLDDAEWRIDVIAIALPATAPPIIEHITDALTWD